MRLTDDERMAMRMLREELRLQDLYIVHDRMEEFVDISIGRVFISQVRALDRHKYGGALPPERPRKIVLENWKARIEAWTRVNEYELIGIVDWLVASCAQPLPWIENLDELGRPKKLMKCATLGALAYEASKWALSRDAMLTNIRLSPDDEHVEMDLGGGLTLVRMMTPAALDVEGARMQHCIGKGGYDVRLHEDYGCRYYSVRASDGEPVATIEVCDEYVDDVSRGVIRQFQGPRNAHPDPVVVARVFESMQKMNWVASWATSDRIEEHTAAPLGPRL